MENHRRALMRVDYEEQDVRAQYRELAREVNSTKAGAGGSSPNIIVVLSESFTDEAYLGQYLDLAEPLMPFYQELVKECRTGRLYVPKLGGGTSETEFEVLTGLRSKYAINPYSMGLPPMNSMASVLRQKGYETTAIHWYSGVYYNRYKNLKSLALTLFTPQIRQLTPLRKRVCLQATRSITGLHPVAASPFEKPRFHLLSDDAKPRRLWI